jgi:hypothetical protein
LDGAFHFTNCWEEERICEMELKSIECVQENGKRYSAIKVGLLKLRSVREGEYIVNSPKSSSSCMKEEGGLAAGAGII